MAKVTKEVATLEDSKFAVTFPMITADTTDVMAAMENNLKSDDVHRRELFTKLPNPKGAEAWTIKTPMGTQVIEKMRCVILHIGNERMYYEDDYNPSETKPPECSSENGITGKGEPGGNCIDCDFSKFSPDGVPPACKHFKPLYVIAPDINPVMPIVLTATGTSFPNLKKFNLGLMQFGVSTFDVELELTVKKQQTKTGQESSVLQFNTLSNIKKDDPQWHQALVGYREKLISFIDPDYQAMKDKLSKNK